MKSLRPADLIGDVIALDKLRKAPPMSAAEVQTIAAQVFPAELTEQICNALSAAVADVLKA